MIYNFAQLKINISIKFNNFLCAIFFMPCKIFKIMPPVCMESVKKLYLQQCIKENISGGQK